MASDDSQAETMAWRNVILSAVRDLSRQRAASPWWAILGPDPLIAKVYGRSSQLFSVPFEIGGMRVEPSGRAYIEEMPILHEGQIAAKDVVITSPAVILGEAERWGSLFDSVESVEKLCLLASMISLYFDNPWVVRGSPQWLSCEPRLLRSVLGERTIEDSGAAFFEVHIPEWFADAWELIESPGALQRAVLTRLEAQRLSWQHPSYAVVAFMSCIQTVGSIYTDRDSKALKTGLLRVLDEDEAKEILRLYEKRSKTAHEGLLFGKETVAGFGSRSIHPFAFDERAAFERESLSRLAEVSRRLLIRELSDADPGDQLFIDGQGWQPHTRRKLSELPSPIAALSSFGLDVRGDGGGKP